jgi:hypothetical protein
MENVWDTWAVMEARGLGHCSVCLSGPDEPCMTGHHLRVTPHRARTHQVATTHHPRLTDLITLQGSIPEGLS